MKTLPYVVVFLLLGCTRIFSPENDGPVEYQQYDGYFYAGPRFNSDSTVFYHFADKAGFDSCFQSASYPFEPDTIPGPEFRRKQVIAVLKYSSSYYTMQVSSVERRNNILYFKYTAELHVDSLSWTPACKLVVTVNCTFDKIRFYENGEWIDE